MVDASQRGRSNQRKGGHHERKVGKNEQRRWDRSEELLWIIQRHQGLTTNDLFLEVSFAHADFTAALRKLENAGKLLVGRKGRAKTYYPAGGV